MNPAERPLRSILYVPGANGRALKKARALPADGVIFDLEDAVVPDEKSAARDRLAGVLAPGGFGGRLRLVRINGLHTEWGREDVAMLQGADLDGVLLPKVSDVTDVEALARLIPDTPVWAMMETATGILNAGTIAACPDLVGMVLGTNDLAADIGSREGRRREPLQTSLQLCLLAARAHGKVCIDGVYNAFGDEDGLLRECEQGRDLGFDGKTLIHPLQIATANAVFAPDAAEVDLARRQIAVFEAAAAQGRGVAVLDGRIVENLHIVAARVLLAKAEAIARLEN